jgi:type II secretory pathway component PulJ
MTTERIVRRPGRKRGYTLVEMIATGTLMALVLTAVAVAISSLHRLHRDMREEIPVAAGLSSLGLQWRLDVHAAGEATIVAPESPKGPPKLRLTSPQETIEYAVAKPFVLRTVQRGEAPLRSDRFRIGTDRDVRWSLEEGEPQLVTLRVSRHAGQLPGAADDVSETEFTSAVGVDPREGEAATPR